MKTIEGNNKRFVVINSTNYNEDNNYSVKVVDSNELAEIGFDKENMLKLSTMKVDDLCYTDYVGCYVIRIA